MKLCDFLKNNRVTLRAFALATHLSPPLLHKVIRGQGSVTLDTALRIHAASKGEVELWELSPNAGKILDEVKTFNLVEIPNRKTRKKKNKENDEQNVEAQDV